MPSLPSSLPAAAVFPPRQAVARLSDEAPGSEAFGRHRLDARCQACDVFCREGDADGPVRFSAYLEKQNRERPHFVLSDPRRPCPAEPTGPNRAAEVDGPAAPAAGRADQARAPALGDVFPSPPPVEAVRHEVTVRYEVHRPVPSGMTIDVFA